MWSFCHSLVIGTMKWDLVTISVYTYIYIHRYVNIEIYRGRVALGPGFLHGCYFGGLRISVMLKHHYEGWARYIYIYMYIYICVYLAVDITH